MDLQDGSNVVGTSFKLVPWIQRRIGLRRFDDRAESEGLRQMGNFNDNIGLRSHRGNASYDGNRRGNMSYVGNHCEKAPYAGIQHGNALRIAAGETTCMPCLGT